MGVNYCGEAWTSGVNYDLDDTALFVLNSGTLQTRDMKALLIRLAER